MDELVTWDHYRAPLCETDLDDAALKLVTPGLISFVFHYYADTFAL